MLKSIEENPLYPIANPESIAFFGASNRFSAMWTNQFASLLQLGFSGGLKAIERRLGLVREDDVIGLDGRDAVVLWAAHCNGDESAFVFA